MFAPYVSLPAPLPNNVATKIQYLLGYRYTLNQASWLGKIQLFSYRSMNFSVFKDTGSKYSCPKCTGSKDTVFKSISSQDTVTMSTGSNGAVF